MTEFELPPALDAQHRRLDADAYDAVYVVGDVHGCLDALHALFEALDPTPDDAVVFVGDLVRRGPDSAGVVEFVRSRENAFAVRGNNEEKLIDGRRPPNGLCANDLAWLRSLPAVVSWDGHVVVHGGLDPRKPLAAHTVTELQHGDAVDATDAAYWWEDYDGPDRVLFGHRVLQRPLVTEHAVGLDTGCVYGGTLTAYDCTRDRTVSVAPTHTHHARSPARFIDPDGAVPG